MSKIRLIDFDYVTLSSLNRHATAGLADVGTPKVKCVEKALRQFSKWVEIDPRIEVWKKEDGAALLEGADWVLGTLFLFLFNLIPSTNILLDAIDNISAKVDLLKHCHDNSIKVRLTFFHLKFAKARVGIFIDGCRSKMRPNSGPDQ